MSKTLRKKNSQDLFIRLLAVMLASSIIFYFVMQLHAKHMQRKLLELSQANISKTINQHGNIADSINEVYKINYSNFISSEFLNEPRDTFLYYPGMNGKYPFKILTKRYTINNKQYELTTFVSTTEINHLIIKVVIAEIAILAVLFIAAIFINRRTSATLWKPFRSTLEKLNAYNVKNNDALLIPDETGIHEFNELNNSIAGVISRVDKAYKNQKQFSENASHEIQTPLAIIRSKIELLIDEPGLNEVTAGLLGEISDANERMSNMNKNLLLLSKIENDQFPEINEVNISSLIDDVIISYKQHYQYLFPNLIKNYNNEIIVSINYSLAEILIQNLIRNAIVHNIKHGYIKIVISNNSLIISNTGAKLSVQPESLFERFAKGKNETKSIGLGLAMVKQICDLYNFEIKYTNKSVIHNIIIIF